jgi:hypothetical protein
MTASIVETLAVVEALAGVTLMVWAGCTLMILLGAIRRDDVLAGGVVDRPHGRARALAVRCGRPVHELIPVWQAVLFAAGALHDPVGAWWGGVIGSVLVVVVWLVICRIGVYNDPCRRRAPWPARMTTRTAGRMARLGRSARYVIVRLHHRFRPSRTALRLDAGALPEQAAANFGEALAAMTVVLEVATSFFHRQTGVDQAGTDHLVDERPVGERAAVDGVIDDPQVVAAWRRASDPARADLMAGLVRYAVLVGVSASDLCPGCPARDLLLFAIVARDEPLPHGPLFGSTAQRVTARAAALIGDPAVPEREKRAVCAQLALALLDRGQHRGQRPGQHPGQSS